MSFLSIKILLLTSILAQDNANIRSKCLKLLYTAPRPILSALSRLILGFKRWISLSILYPLTPTTAIIMYTPIGKILTITRKTTHNSLLLAITGTPLLTYCSSAQDELYHNPDAENMSLPIYDISSLFQTLSKHSLYLL